MRTPQKARKIYEQLRMDILQRRYAPGELLPTEVDLAVQLGVSRDTLRNALAMLADDALVRRVRGHGSYVSETVSRKKVTFLLPYAYNLEASSGLLVQVHHGAIEGARECNCELESLAISPSNNPTDIDWSKLYNLNSESLVIVAGYWFQEIYPFLLASKCKVAVIHDQLRQSPFIGRSLQGWCDIIKRTKDNDRNMVLHLLEKVGCRKPLFIHSYLENEFSLFKETATKTCREFSPKIKPRFIYTPTAEYHNTPEKIDAAIVDALKKGVDGCIVNLPYHYQALRRYAPALPCGVFGMNQYNFGPADEHTFYSEFPFFQIGRETVHYLAADDASQGKVFYYEANIRTGTNTYQ